MAYKRMKELLKPPDNNSREYWCYSIYSWSLKLLHSQQSEVRPWEDVNLPGMVALLWQLSTNPQIHFHLAWTHLQCLLGKNKLQFRIPEDSWWWQRLPATTDVNMEEVGLWIRMGSDTGAWHYRSEVLSGAILWFFRLECFNLIVFIWREAHLSYSRYLRNFPSKGRSSTKGNGMMPEPFKQQLWEVPMIQPVLKNPGLCEVSGNFSFNPDSWLMCYSYCFTGICCSKELSSWCLVHTANTNPEPVSI